ncbi:hypothetical protein [Enorma phocaeensis]|uniref:hypothetical protein n=1 Tax=Enorma phocaeensis TaxID=1871019 RepID=UPI0011AEE8BE|nr:hypothetical protein [Enorma phocaeensis]
MNDFISGAVVCPPLRASESSAFAAHVRTSTFQIARYAVIRTLAGPRNRTYLNCAAKIPRLRNETPSGHTDEPHDGTHA